MYFTAHRAGDRFLIIGGDRQLAHGLDACRRKICTGSTSGWGRIARPPVETGVWHEKLAKARLPVGAIAGLSARFNALFLPDGRATLGFAAMPPP